MDINKDRLAETFVTLCEIDSPSKQEGRVAAYVKDVFGGLNGEIIEDNSAETTGSDCGNIVVRFPGNGLDLDPVFFNCHLDTVQPGEGVRVHREGDTFTSRGDTVLGADDKSGIAVLIEVIRTLQEQNIPHGPVELLFTTCEEVGLLGVKAFAAETLQARVGYAMDTTGTDQVITGAPAANRFDAVVTGHSAHAGLAPEQGVNAIHLAAQAVAELHLGRIDEESTANIGLITGGTATNIVPDKVIVKGEIRSHSEDRLTQYTEEFEETFRQVVDDWTDPTGFAAGTPTVSLHINKEYPVMKLVPDAPALQRVERAAASLGRTLEYIVAGGGSDANILNSYGLSCAILGTGMANVHTVDECIELGDMVKTAELVASILTT